MGRICPSCSSSTIEEDSGRGDAICTACGTVIEESTIVSDVQFQERGGGHEVIGQFVSRDRAQPNTLSNVPGVSHNESRDVTFAKGRARILEISNQLHINQHCIELAYNFFKMCVNKNLTRGRYRSHVVVSCLYMTCRIENTSHLLLDFSDVTQINIFDLGRTLTFLTRSLCIKLPPTDPCMYILRFASVLDLAEKQREIVLLATRIVQRMKLDWMSTGRRPTGLCGAALLLAARAFNINRTVSDVVQVVHISHSVVRKRLDEFASTPSGSLTIDEFSNVELEECEDPPSFQESKRRILEVQKQMEEDKAEEVVKEVEDVRREIEAVLIKKMKKSPYMKIMTGFEEDNITEFSQTDRMIGEEIFDTIYEVANESSSNCKPSEREKLEIYGPNLHSLGIGAKSTAAFDNHHWEENLNGELDLAGIDEDELDSYILTEEEAQLKSEYWMKRNGEHLSFVEQKRKMKEEDERNKNTNPKKKRKTARKKEATGQPTHNEAIFQVIQEKNLSRKINYEILKQIEETERK